MNIVILLLLVIIICGTGIYGGHAQWYPMGVGYGGSLVTLLVVLLILKVLGII